MTTKQAKQIFNLVGDYDKSSLKKLYRLKAKQLHPDTNTSNNAQVEFIQLKIAYDVLLRNLTHPQQKTIKINIPSEKEVRKARAYHQQKKRASQEAAEQKKAHESYIQFVSSSAFMWHKIRVSLAVLFMAIYALDEILPSKVTEHSIVEFTFEKAERAAGGLLKQKTTFENIVFYTNPGFITDQHVLVYKSTILGLLTDVKFSNRYSKPIFVASKSMLLLLLSGLFFPIVGYFIKGPNIYFLMSVRWSQIAIPFTLLFMLLEQSKLFASF